MTVIRMFARRPVEAGRLVTSADVSTEPPPGAVRSALLLAGDWLRVGGLVVAAATLGAMALCAAGVSAVAARASKRAGAPSAAPMSTRHERELRKAIRRSFIATGMTGLDLGDLRREVKHFAAEVAHTRQRLSSARSMRCRIGSDDVVVREHIKRIEAGLAALRRTVRGAELRYAAACAAAGAIPTKGGAR